MNKFIVIFLLISTQAFGQTSSKLREVFKNKTVIENPFDLRDPFKAPLIKGNKKEGRKEKSLMRDGIYTNIDPLGTISVDKVRIVGVMIGKERRALARLEGREDIVVLREGMRLGADNAELKAIHPGGVILVEKLVNVYGEEEYLETVIPISQ
ncbi:MAG: pilus assembly protein PilP [Bacteriovoracaceae bacterium]|nr:pilus assembly protein PilP [Bacteriovoracaceae bacterium]